MGAAAITTFIKSVLHDYTAAHQGLKKFRSDKDTIISQSAGNDKDLPHKPPAKQPLGPSNKPRLVATDVAGNIEPAHPDTKKFTPKKNTFTEDFTLRNKDQKWLHDTQTVPVTTKMADVEMSGAGDSAAANSANQTTPVSNFPYAFEGIPRQYTTILPFNYTRTDGSISNVAGSRATSIYLRMNSVYDILKADGNTYAADPTVAADVADAGTKEMPLWRNYWQQFYEYWTVVECRYKISGYIKNDSTGYQMGILHGYVGLQKPPIVSTGSTDITYDEYKHWKGYKIDTVHSAQLANQLNSMRGPNYFELSGVYHPGDGVHEIAEDELVQTWVKGDSVPKEQNLLMVRFFYMPWSSTTAAITFNYRVDMEYVVQYKDQKAIWQFPHAETGSSAVKISQVIP